MDYFRNRSRYCKNLKNRPKLFLIFALFLFFKHFCSCKTKRMTAILQIYPKYWKFKMRFFEKFFGRKFLILGGLSSGFGPIFWILEPKCHLVTRVPARLQTLTPHTSKAFRIFLNNKVPIFCIQFYDMTCPIICGKYGIDMYNTFFKNQTFSFFTRKRPFSNFFYI